MPNCDRCENYFSPTSPESPCAACLTKGPATGFKRAKLGKQIRILIHRTRLRAKRGRK